MQKILTDPEYAHWELCPYDAGVVVDGQTERWVPFEKIRDAKHSIGWGTWLDKYGYNSDATSELKQIFGNKPFDTPKPLALVQWIISLYDSEDTIVLDSFSGSGTTAHAVLNVNKTDGGNRKFIMIEMMDYAEEITAERIKRVITGYGDGAKAVEGIDESFSFYELGDPLFLDGYLNPSISVDSIREYIWYTETNTEYNRKPSDNPYFLGTEARVAYYFCYETDRAVALNSEILSSIQEKADRYIIYADTCELSQAALDKYNVVFKKIPRDITHF